MILSSSKSNKEIKFESLQKSQRLDKNRDMNSQIRKPNRYAEPIPSRHQKKWARIINAFMEVQNIEGGKNLINKFEQLKDLKGIIG